MSDAYSFMGGSSLAAAASNYQASKLQSASLAAKNSHTPEAMKKVAKEYEGVFMGELLKQMFDTVPQDEMFGGGYAEETYKEMLVDQYGKKLSENGGLGLADSIQSSMERAEGIKTAPKATTIDAAKAYQKIYSYNFNNK